MDTAETLLRECLNALNAAPRFIYGPRCKGRAARYAKPDSYDLAARLERHLGEPVTRPEKPRTGEPPENIAAGCNVSGRTEFAAVLVAQGKYQEAAREYATLARLLAGAKGSHDAR